MPVCAGVGADSSLRVIARLRRTVSGHGVPSSDAAHAVANALMQVRRELAGSRAAHAVAAVEAAVAGAATDGQGTAVVASRGIALEVGELAVLLAEALGRRSARGWEGAAAGSGW